MRIVEVREEAGLRDLRPAWDELLVRSASGTIFLTWEWMSAWWAAYGTPGDLRILLALDGQDRLRGLAPLRQQTVRKYGQRYSMLSFIGDGSNDSDYLDFVISAGDEPAVTEAFRKHWEGELSQGILLQLNEIPESSPNLLFLRELGGRRGMIWTEADVPCGTVALPDLWQTYLSKLAPRFRTKVRSVLRNIEARGDMRFQFCERPEQLETLLPALFKLHGRRWAKEAKPGVFRGEPKRAFYRSLSPLLLDRGRLGFSWLESRGHVLACQYGFFYQDRYFQLQEGYDPECEHLNVGICLRAWSIQELMKRGIREYDFLGGVGRHKTDWGARTKLSKRIILGRSHARNVLYCRGPEWESSAREAVKAWLPEGILQARATRMERRRSELARPPDAGEASSSWMRGVLAGLYFHSPLPALLPRFRDRYQMEIARNGASKIRWQKRREPSARILYFHRVNDENDPFIGGLSTAAFAQQMKYLARHYRVVSLREATKRLSEGGPPEPVVAITFDDGYQDNFRNAFPALLRYGLPATIFLATGTVDSRQRPWFEILSLAVKRTSHTYIDLELDLPRRFWMRTEAERLQAKTRIFELVKDLPDAERRQRVCEIVGRLGAGEDAEDTMLTWDQIRLMNHNQIDFGGHTVTHPFISRLEPAQAAWEVSECKRRIEQELQMPVEHFAYPNGRPGDFEEWNKQLLREAGYQNAVSTLWGVNYPSTDCMELRRGQPWEEEPAVFAAKLDWYQWADM
jgi:peptidoglycan/xylan/chitin deacetylase (PgdA/CDA1 family)/CelD/BcsL family acetyltransferase involved in cellulose biosynthesis